MRESLVGTGLDGAQNKRQLIKISMAAFFMDDQLLSHNICCGRAFPPLYDVKRNPLALKKRFKAL